MIDIAIAKAREIPQSLIPIFILTDKQINIWKISKQEQFSSSIPWIWTALTTQSLEIFQEILQLTKIMVTSHRYVVIIVKLRDNVKRQTSLKKK